MVTPGVGVGMVVTLSCTLTLEPMEKEQILQELLVGLLTPMHLEVAEQQMHQASYVSLIFLLLGSLESRKSRG